MVNLMVYSIIGLFIYYTISFIYLEIIKPSRDWEDKIKKM